MDTSFHTMNTLFSQLGLPDDEASIKAFILEHHHLNQNVRIDKAPFWTTVQARFLREAYQDDSDWVEIVDSLDAQLRH